MYLLPCVVGRVCRLFCDWRLAPDLIRRQEFLNLLDAQVIGSGKFFSHHSGPKANRTFPKPVFPVPYPDPIKYDAAGDSGPGLPHVAAFRSDAIDSLMIARRVVLPQDTAVTG